MKLYKPTIVRKEIDDKHYYYVDGKYFPGVTTILSETLPTSPFLRKWIGDVGNEKAEAKMNSAALRGTAIHDACELLLKHQELKLNEPFVTYKKDTYNFTNGDKKCIVGFTKWINEFKPDIKKESDIEMVVASQDGYAGTLDLHCYIDEVPYIIDFKTSSGIYDSHLLQVTSYQKAFYEMTGIKAKRGILHLNNRTKAGYKFHDEKEFRFKQTGTKKYTKIKMEDFTKVFEMYKMLNGGIVPEPRLKSVYPEIISLYEEESVKTDMI